MAIVGAAMTAWVPAAAQVLEISPSGDVATIAGPTVFTVDGAAPIIPAAPKKLSGGPPADVALAIEAAAARHDVSPALAEAVAWRESRFRQEAVSIRGARGVMQLMPGTAREMGVDAADMTSNVDGGVAYLAAMLRRFGGDMVMALSAYNAGPAAVARHRGTPPYPETRAYVAAILERLAAAAAVSQEIP